MFSNKQVSTQFKGNLQSCATVRDLLLKRATEKIEIEKAQHSTIGSLLAKFVQFFMIKQAPILPQMPETNASNRKSQNESQKAKQ